MFGVYIGSGHVSLIRCHYIFFIYFANILNSFQKSTTRRSLQCPEREGTTAPYKRYPRWLLVLWLCCRCRLNPSSQPPSDPFISPASWPLHLSRLLTPAPLPAAHECSLLLLCSLLYSTHAGIWEAATAEARSWGLPYTGGQDHAT